jgi:hypothetical protein
MRGRTAAREACRRKGVQAEVARERERNRFLGCGVSVCTRPSGREADFGLVEPCARATYSLSLSLLIVS